MPPLKISEGNSALSGTYSSDCDWWNVWLMWGHGSGLQRGVRSGKKAQHSLEERWDYQSPKGTLPKDGEIVTSSTQQRGLRSPQSYTGTCEHPGEEKALDESTALINSVKH